MNEIMKRLYKAALELKDIQEIGRQSAVARLLGESPQTVKNWETRGPSKNGLIQAQRMIGCSINWLESGIGSMTQSQQSNVDQSPSIQGTVPLISWVQAGNWEQAIDTLLTGQGERISTTYKPKNHTYALRVRGDSMEPKFPDGCIIIIEPDEHPAPGQYVIIRQNGDDVTFKQLVKDGGSLFLKPLNARYPIMELKNDAIFCGVVKRMEMDV